MIFTSTLKAEKSCLILHSRSTLKRKPPVSQSRGTGSRKKVWRDTCPRGGSLDPSPLSGRLSRSRCTKPSFAIITAARQVTLHVLTIAIFFTFSIPNCSKVSVAFFVFQNIGIGDTPPPICIIRSNVQSPPPPPGVFHWPPKTLNS